MGFSYVVEISRQRGSYIVWFRTPEANFDISAIAWRICAAIYWLHGAEGDFGRLTFDLSDGNIAGKAIFHACSPDPAAALLPDGQFFEHRGYAPISTLAQSIWIPWQERSGRLVWRGANTGDCDAPAENPDPSDPGLPQRLRMVLALRAGIDCDVRYSANIRGPAWDPVMQRFDLLGDYIPQWKWVASKFALNVDGNSNAWINPLAKMHLGCCVINIESDRGYRQWWHDRWKPWDHYIPVRPDMEDLLDKIAWARANDEQARHIAARGTQLARTITLQGEAAWAARKIAQTTSVSANRSA